MHKRTLISPSESVPSWSVSRLSNILMISPERDIGSRDASSSRRLLFTYIYIYIYIYTHTYTHTYTYSYIYIYIEREIDR